MVEAGYPKISHFKRFIAYRSVTGESHRSGPHRRKWNGSSFTLPPMNACHGCCTSCVPVESRCHCSSCVENIHYRYRYHIFALWLHTLCNSGAVTHVKALSSVGMSALYAGTVRGRVELCAFRLSFGAGVGVYNSTSATPGMRAACLDHTRVVALLIGHGGV